MDLLRWMIDDDGGKKKQKRNEKGGVEGSRGE